MAHAPIPRRLLTYGAALFLLGLLNGWAIPLVENPRMGLSAHLTAVQSALVLWALGLLWERLRLSAWAEALASWSAVVGAYVLWLGLLLAAVWGASRSLPIAGDGFAASPTEEGVVTALVVGGSAAITVAAAFVLFGLVAAAPASRAAAPISP